MSKSEGTLQITGFTYWNWALEGLRWKVTWKSHSSNLSLFVLVRCPWQFLHVGWSLGAAGHGHDQAHPQVDVDLCKNPPSAHRSAQLPPPPEFLPTDSMPPGSLVWQPKMVAVGISLALQAGVLDSSLLLSLEKVVSQAPGLLSHAFSFSVMIFCIFFGLRPIPYTSSYPSILPPPS